jgi:hypothetical protein
MDESSTSAAPLSRDRPERLVPGPGESAPSGTYGVSGGGPHAAGGSEALSLGGATRAHVKEAVQPITATAKEVAEQQKVAGAEVISGVAQAVHRAADELATQLPAATGYVHEAADRLERASSALRERSVDDLIGSVDRFARQQPVAFFGTAVLAGLAVSRFLKSSRRRPASPRSPQS